MQLLRDQMQLDRQRYRQVDRDYCAWGQTIKVRIRENISMRERIEVKVCRALDNECEHNIVLYGHHKFQ